jgi:hypothetical protein
MNIKVSTAMVEAGVNALANSRRLSDEMVVANVFRDMVKAHNREEADKRKEPAPAYVHQAFPSWRYGPNGAAMLCQTEAEVPEGWASSPAEYVGAADKKAPAQKRAA